MIAASMFLFASCGTDVEDTTGNITYSALNFVTPMNGEGDPFFVESNYAFYFNFSQAKTSVAVNGLKLNNVDYNFTTDTIAYNQYYVQTTQGVGMYNEIKGAKANVNKDKLLPLGAFNCEITGLFYWNTTVIPGFDSPKLQNGDGSMLVMQYNIGNEYTVRTVQPDEFFSGTTVTTINMGGTMSQFENKEAGYRVKLNKDYKTADVIIYNARFAEQMPKLTAVVLRGLDVKFEDGNYYIEGKDIIPQVPESGALTDYTNYPFNNFELTFTDHKLTCAYISYNVSVKMGDRSVPAYGNVNDASYLLKVTNAQ